MIKEKRTMESLEVDAKATWIAACAAYKANADNAIKLSFDAQCTSARAKLVRCYLAEGATFEEALAYCDDVEREITERD